MVSIRGRWPADSWRAGPGGDVLVGAEAEVESGRARRQRFKEPPASELARRYALLEQAAVFYTLPERFLRSLARRLRPVAIPAGGVVVQEGEASGALFFIESGHCQIRLESGPRNRVAVALLGRGDYFGEVSCLTEEPARETAIALDDCRLLALDRTAIYTVLEPETELLAELLRFGRQRAAGHAGIAAQLGSGRRTGPGSVTALYSPKGGSGRTTLALNVSATLARRHPGEVVLVDLSLPFAQAALLANLVPAGSLARAADAEPQMAEEILLSAALFHPAGLMILPGCVRPEEADLVTPELVAGALEILRRHFRHVIVDLGVAMTEPVLAVFDQADRVLLIVPPELAAIKGAQDAYSILTSVLGMAGERITLITNSRAPRPTITREALERRLGAPVAVAVDFDGDRPDKAVLEGALLAERDPGSEIARAARSIAAILDTGEITPGLAGGSDAGRQGGGVDR